MSVLRRAEDIVVEFLRCNVSDVRNRYTSDSNFFVASAGQKKFVLVPANVGYLVRCVNSVKINSVDAKKWLDYSIDLRKKTIEFNTGLTDGDKVDVDFSSSESGSEWIYPGFPIATMNSEKFPRISVTLVSKTGDRLGSYLSDLGAEVWFQVDVWTKENFKAKVDGEIFWGQDLADLLAEKVEYCFIKKINELYPKFYDYFGLGYGQVDFDESSQTFRHKQEFMLRGVNVGHYD